MVETLSASDELVLAVVRCRWTGRPHTAVVVAVGRAGAPPPVDVAADDVAAAAARSDAGRQGASARNLSSVTSMRATRRCEQPVNIG